MDKVYLLISRYRERIYHLAVFGNRESAEGMKRTFEEYDLLNGNTDHRYIVQVERIRN